MRNSWQNILDYLRGRLTSKETHKVERDALDDPSCQMHWKDWRITIPG